MTTSNIKKIQGFAYFMQMESTINANWWYYSQINLIKGMILELSVLHDYGYFQNLFDIAGIKSIDYFFLAAILIMTMFNFQFRVRMKIGSFY